MSTTDNAFIKVYQRGPMDGSARDPWQHIIQPHSAGFVTTTETVSPWPTESRPVSDYRPTESNAQTHAARVPKPEAARVGGGEPLREKSLRPVAGANVWTDAPHGGPKPPHVKMDRYAKGAAARPLAPQHAGTTIVRFAPSWEVDQFNWPPVCSELQDCWVSPLNSVVRSVVRQAWQGGNIVAVTQAVRGEGSTTLALCLGRIASAFQIPVALIDGHRHNSGVAAALRLHFELGWDETSPNCPLEEAAIRSLQDGLVVLPIRPGDLRQDWEVPDDLRARMLDQLAASFELVIVDVGPMFVAAHEWFAGPLAGRISCALVVRDVRTTESAQTDDVCHRLRTAGVRNVSIIENFQLA